MGIVNSIKGLIITSQKYDTTVSLLKLLFQGYLNYKLFIFQNTYEELYDFKLC